MVREQMVQVQVVAMVSVFGCLKASLCSALTIDCSNASFCSALTVMSFRACGLPLVWASLFWAGMVREQMVQVHMRVGSVVRFSEAGVSSDSLIRGHAWCGCRAFRWRVGFALYEPDGAIPQRFHDVRVGVY